MDATDAPSLISIGALGIATGALATVSYGICSPASSLLCPVITRADEPTPGRLALTFDDGPFPETTPKVLDLLAKYDVHATFFVIGRYLDGESERVRASREVLKNVVHAGHLVARLAEGHGQRQTNVAEPHDPDSHRRSV